MHDKTTFGAALLALAASLVACHAPTELSDPAEPQATASAEAAAAPSDYRLVVRFIYAEGGTNEDARVELGEMIEERKLAFDSHRWGENGEHSLCLRLDELQAPERTAFISDVTQAFAATGRVAIQENTTCVW